MNADTIFALASGAGRGAIAVLRLSGPGTAGVIAALAGGLPAPRRASLRVLREADGAVLDHALVLWFPAPGSYSGEDSGELHLHGGVAVTEAVAAALVAAGARPAEAGEFTRRAFLNGKLDLLEAEAVNDLIGAETRAQARQALRQMEGALSAIHAGWAGRLRWAVAQQEALIDFPDEDLPPEVETRLLAEMAALATEMAGHLDDGRRGERLREGLVFAITGAPNVGKSSLMNALAGREVAIVAPSPGTTRDALEARVVLGGVPVTLVDTAGLRETDDPVEAEGVRRAQARAAEADFCLLVGVAGAEIVGRADLVVANKTDLGGQPQAGQLGVSVASGAGLELLRARLDAAASALTRAEGPPPLTRARHRAALVEAVGHLEAARAAAWPELRGEDLRLALRALGRVTGAVGVEDILDAIFRQFCIGK